MLPSQSNFQNSRNRAIDEGTGSQDSLIDKIDDEDIALRRSAEIGEDPMRKSPKKRKSKVGSPHKHSPNQEDRPSKSAKASGIKKKKQKKKHSKKKKKKKATQDPSSEAARRKAISSAVPRLPPLEPPPPIVQQHGQSDIESETTSSLSLPKAYETDPLDFSTSPLHAAQKLKKPPPSNASSLAAMLGQGIIISQKPTFELPTTIQGLPSQRQPNSAHQRLPTILDEHTFPPGSTTSSQVSPLTKSSDLASHHNLSSRASQRRLNTTGPQEKGGVTSVLGPVYIPDGFPEASFDPTDRKAAAPHRKRQSRVPPATQGGEDRKPAAVRSILTTQEYQGATTGSSSPTMRQRRPSTAVTATSPGTRSPVYVEDFHSLGEAQQDPNYIPRHRRLGIRSETQEGAIASSPKATRRKAKNEQQPDPPRTAWPAPETEMGMTSVWDKSLETLHISQGLTTSDQGKVRDPKQDDKADVDRLSSFQAKHVVSPGTLRKTDSAKESESLQHLQRMSKLSSSSGSWVTFSAAQRESLTQSADRNVGSVRHIDSKAPSVEGSPESERRKQAASTSSPDVARNVQSTLASPTESQRKKKKSQEEKSPRRKSSKKASKSPQEPLSPTSPKKSPSKKKSKAKKKMEASPSPRIPLVSTSSYLGSKVALIPNDPTPLNTLARSPPTTDARIRPTGATQTSYSRRNSLVFKSGRLVPSFDPPSDGLPSPEMVLMKKQALSLKRRTSSSSSSRPMDHSSTFSRAPTEKVRNFKTGSTDSMLGSSLSSVALVTPSTSASELGSPRPNPISRKGGAAARPRLEMSFSNIPESTGTSSVEASKASSSPTSSNPTLPVGNISPASPSRRKSHKSPANVAGVSTTLSSGVVDPSKRTDVEDRLRASSNRSDPYPRQQSYCESLKERPAILMIGVCVLAVVFATVTVATLLATRSEDTPTPQDETRRPTSAPSASQIEQASTSDIKIRLPRNNNNNNISKNNDSVHHRSAITWMTETDNVSPTISGARWHQRFALAVLYFSTAGPDWLDRSNWLDPDLHECDWDHRISCFDNPDDDDDDNRVVDGIDLTRNGLRGTLPTEICNLSELRKFWLLSPCVCCEKACAFASLTLPLFFLV